jgi:hypothetical protein
MMLRYCVLVIAILSITTANVRAAGFHVPTLGEVLQRSGEVTIPAAWSGIWSHQDSLHLCGNPTIFLTGTGEDTLCTGGAFPQGPGGVTLDCTGTVDDDSADLTCTGTDDSDPTCIIHYNLLFVATRNGENFFAEGTVTTTHEPQFCDFDACIVTEITATRVAPEPAECLTPVEASTWGMLKARYR